MFEASQKVCVQYGCGWSAPAGWHNFDASPTLRLERIPLAGRILRKNATWFPASVRPGDIVKGLPFAPNSVDCIYASHVLEHLSYEGCRRALEQTHLILKPGGEFRLVVPDLRWRAERYLRDAINGESSAAPMFLTSTLLGRRKRKRGLRGLVIQHFGNSEHLWMWDAPSLTALLAEVGFTDIRHCQFGDSSHPEFREVENRERFFDSGQEELALSAGKAEGASMPAARKRHEALR